MLDAFTSFVSDGGYVMPPLVALTFVLWYALGWRGARLFLPRPTLDGPALKLHLGAGRTMVRAIVMVAPLLGLLGTVSGMIETFDSLGDQALFAATGGVAGGISQALLTTQMGLVVAIPGLVVGRLLDRRQRALEDAACA